MIYCKNVVNIALLLDITISKTKKLYFIIFPLLTCSLSPVSASLVSITLSSLSLLSISTSLSLSSISLSSSLPSHSSLPPSLSTSHLSPMDLWVWIWVCGFLWVWICGFCGFHNGFGFVGFYGFRFVGFVGFTMDLGFLWAFAVIMVVDGYGVWAVAVYLVVVVAVFFVIGGSGLWFQFGVFLFYFFHLSL